MRSLLFAVSLLAASPASAASMQLLHQGRLLDASGGAVEGVHTLTATLRDGSGNEHFSEEFAGVHLQSGYFALQLGSGESLDTSVFLNHGAMHLEIAVDGVALSTTPMGGYPVLVAQQAELSLESSSQQALSDIADLSGDVAALSGAVAAIALEVGDIASDRVRPRYSKTCEDWSATGWDSIADCRQDGRWHYYAKTTGTFDSHAGFADWHAASVQGADTKMRIGLEWYRVTVRSNANPNSGVWVFVAEGTSHLSFVVQASGQVDSIYASPGDATFHNHWWDGHSLGNWHYFTSGYTRRDSAGMPNEGQHGGMEFWARY